MNVTLPHNHARGAYSAIVYPDNADAVVKDCEGIEIARGEPGAAICRAVNLGARDIYISSGEYYFLTPVLLRQSGQRFHIHGSYDTKLVSARRIPAFFTSGDGNTIYNPRMEIDHLSTSGALLFSGGCYYSQFHNNFADDGLVSITDPSGDLSDAIDNWVYENHVHATGSTPLIKFYETGTDNLIFSNVLHMDSSVAGIYIDSANGNQIHDNHIYGVETGNIGIYIRRTSDVLCHHNKIELAQIYSYGIYVNAALGKSCNKIIIDHNWIQALIPNMTGARAIRFTESDGTAPASLVTIDHNDIFGDPEYGIDTPNITRSSITYNTFREMVYTNHIVSRGADVTIV